MPRRNCKHINQVIDEKPEPLDQKNWDALRGKKKKVKDFIDKIDKIQNENPEPEIITATIFIDGKPFTAYNGSSFVKQIFGGKK